MRTRDLRFVDRRDNRCTKVVIRVLGFIARNFNKGCGVLALEVSLAMVFLCFY